MKPDIQLNNEAISLREEFGIDSHSPVDIFGLIASNRDMTVTFLPMSARISGLCIKSDDVKSYRYQLIPDLRSAKIYGRPRVISHFL